MAGTVAVCQIEVVERTLTENVETACTRLAESPEMVELAVFPEYALTGVPGAHGEPPVGCHQSGSELERIHATARETGVDVVVGFTEYVPTDDAWYNTVWYLSQDGDVTVYRKQHLWGTEAE